MRARVPVLLVSTAALLLGLAGPAAAQEADAGTRVAVERASWVVLALSLIHI